MDPTPLPTTLAPAPPIPHLSDSPPFAPAELAADLAHATTAGAEMYRQILQQLVKHLPRATSSQQKQVVATAVQDALRETDLGNAVTTMAKVGLPTLERGAALAPLYPELWSSAGSILFSRTHEAQLRTIMSSDPAEVHRAQWEGQSSTRAERRWRIDEPLTTADDVLRTMRHYASFGHAASGDEKPPYGHNISLNVSAAALCELAARYEGFASGIDLHVNTDNAETMISGRVAFYDGEGKGLRLHAEWWPPRHVTAANLRQFAQNELGADLITADTRLLEAPFGTSVGYVPHTHRVQPIRIEVVPDGTRDAIPKRPLSEVEEAICGHETSDWRVRETNLGDSGLLELHCPCCAHTCLDVAPRLLVSPDDPRRGDDASPQLLARTQAMRFVHPSMFAAPTIDLDRRLIEVLRAATIKLQRPVRLRLRA